MVPFEQVCTFEYGKSLPMATRREGAYIVMGSNGPSGNHNEYLVKRPGIVVGRKGSAGEVTWVESNFFPIDTTYFVKVTDETKTDIRYVFHLLKTLNLPELRGGAGIPGLNRNDVYQKFSLPLPPLQVQQEIVAEIEGYQRVIDGAGTIIENYRPHIPVDPDWPVVEMGELCTTITDGDHQPPPKAEQGVPFVTISNLDEMRGIDFEKTFFVPRKYFEALKDNRRPHRGDLLYSVTGSYGVVVSVTDNREFCFQRHIALLRPSDKVMGLYLLHYLRSPSGKQQGDNSATGVAQKTVSLRALRKFMIPLPPLDVQQAIVSEIEEEQAIINSNRELIMRFEKKIDAAIARVWGEAKADEAAA
jgi:restriction endonuclease S subunit